MLRSPTDTTLSRAVRTIYAAGLDPARWGDTLAAIRGLTDWQVARLTIQSGETLLHQMDIAERRPDALQQEYEAHWVAHDPILKHLGAFPVGVPMRAEELVPGLASTLDRTGYGNDYLRAWFPEAPDLGSGCIPVRTPDLTIMLGGSYGTTGRAGIAVRLEVLERLMPHLARAGQLHLRLGTSAAASAASALVDTIEPAVFLADRRGAILELNPAAEALLRARRGLSLRDGRLVADDPATSSTLEGHIRAAALTGAGLGAAAGGAVAVRGGDGRALAAWVTPLHEDAPAFARAGVAAAVVVRDPSTGPPRDALAAAARQLGLTPAQARLAALLSSGCRVAEAAERLGIREITARNHLRAALSRLGVKRQVELVRVVLQTWAPFRTR